MTTTEPHPETPSATPVGGDTRFLDHLASAADLVAARRFGESEVEVLQALTMAPGDARALKLLALVRFKLGRLHDARAACRELAAMLPEDAGIRLKLGLIALKLEEPEEAVRELELCTRLDPEDLRGWSYLGFAYGRLGEVTRAAEAFRRAGQEENAAEVERGEEIPAPTLDADSDGIVPLSSVIGDGLPAAELEARDAAAPSGAAAAKDSGALPFEGALPVAPYEQDFDLPDAFPAVPTGPRSAVSVDSPLAVGSDAAVPVVPLVAYAVSRLAPASDAAAWVGATARFPIGEEIFVRADAAVACSGTARWEPAFRRVRGRVTDERLGGEGSERQSFCRVTGRGDLFVAAPTGRLVPLRLEDDILYVREDHVLAFEGSISWEYGHVPRAPAGGRMLQFRGRGMVALRVEGEPGAVKVTPERSMFVSSANLLGWVGRVAASGSGGGHRGGGHPGGNAGIAISGGPSAQAMSSGVATDGPVAADPFGIVCEGEGVVLIDVKVGPRARQADRSGTPGDWGAR